MILSGNEIKKLVKLGKIKVKPYSAACVGPASIDMHLGDEFRVFAKNKFTLHSNKEDYKKHSRVVKKKKVTLPPGELIHGITKESISLPENIAGRLDGRSSMARLGLTVHVTAGFVQPGSKGKQVLEIANQSKSPVVLVAGTKICQIILSEVKNPGKGYSGKFKGQMKP